jgi:hypothetical protein
MPKDIVPKMGIVMLVRSPSLVGPSLLANVISGMAAISGKKAL